MNRTLLSLVVGSHVTLAVVKHVHVALANGNLTSVLLETSEKILVKVHARVLLLLLLLVSGLLLSVVHLLAAFGLLFLGSGTVATARAAHHCANTLVSDLGASAESHACGHGAHEATAHTSHAAALCGSGCWGSSLRRLGSRSWGS